ncbi:MAG: sugar phosphate isomerase/epimerase family protein [Kiritimatiellia bacterium]
MGRPVTLFTGQFADIPLETLCKKAKAWGYEGLELACWGDHVDAARAAKDPAYAKTRKTILADHGLKLFAISSHLAGQLVCDPNDDERSDLFAPPNCAGNAEKKRAFAVQSMKDAAVAAKNIGVKIVNGFTGSGIWHMLYSFPPVSDARIQKGFDDFAKLWNPILDVFDKSGVRFALEVHPTEIAFDIVTARRALKALKNRKAFGFNFDPSHLHWQGVDPVAFLKAFPDRIYHVHMKDAAVTLDGESSILASHLNFGTPGRGWDFRSLGRGQIKFEEIIRTLNILNYKGPLSVEWEDAMMDREHGAAEACAFVKKVDFPKSDRVFDEAFGK